MLLKEIKIKIKTLNRRKTPHRKNIAILIRIRIFHLVKMGRKCISR